MTKQDLQSNLSSKQTNICLIPFCYSKNNSVIFKTIYIHNTSKINKYNQNLEVEMGIQFCSPLVVSSMNSPLYRLWLRRSVIGITDQFGVQLSSSPSSPVGSSRHVGIATFDLIDVEGSTKNKSDSFLAPPILILLFSVFSIFFIFPAFISDFSFQHFNFCLLLFSLFELHLCTSFAYKDVSHIGIWDAR